MAERAGARSRLTGVVGAVVIVLMLVPAPGLFRNLPQPALAAMVITVSLPGRRAGAVRGASSSGTSSPAPSTRSTCPPP
ncbi:SulP family inorganic anion transporter [Streptomyces sp. NPDC090741]|uniref:SulP family inorganic anion transporter n=1 Tax=Streptomyces sp. NPDC090741 TaxID=3365967 RepID=UPI00381CD929